MKKSFFKTLATAMAVVGIGFCSNPALAAGEASIDLNSSAFSFGNSANFSSHVTSAATDLAFAKTVFTGSGYNMDGTVQTETKGQASSNSPFGFAGFAGDASGDLSKAYSQSFFCIPIGSASIDLCSSVDAKGSTFFSALTTVDAIDMSKAGTHLSGSGLNLEGNTYASSIGDVSVNNPWAGTGSYIGGADAGLSYNSFVW